MTPPKKLHSRSFSMDGIKSWLGLKQPQASTPAEPFREVAGQVMEWRDGRYRPLPLADGISHFGMIVLEDGRPIMKMSMRRNEIGGDGCPIMETQDTPVAEYASGGWRILPFLYSVTPGVYQAADRFKREFPIQAGLAGGQVEIDHHIACTYYSNYPLGMRYDLPRQQLEFLLAGAEGLLRVRPHVITILAPGQTAQQQQRVALTNAPLSFAGFVILLRYLQANMTAYTPDGISRSFFYGLSLHAPGNGLDEGEFARDFTAVFADKKVYKRSLGEIERELFAQIGAQGDQRYTPETLRQQFTWSDPAPFLNGADPWSAAELDAPGVFAELMLFEPPDVHQHIFG